MATDIHIANRALARIGCLPISSFDEDTPAVQNIQRTYESALEDLLSKGCWKFAIRTAPLSRLASIPERQWAYAYNLPPDRLGLPRAYYQDKTCIRPLTKFQLTDNQMWTDAVTVWAEYPHRPIPGNWPGYFRELMVLVLAGELALVIREDQSLRRELRLNAYGSEMYQGEGGQMGIAMSLEAQSVPAHDIDGGHNPLISVRHTPYAYGDARSGYEDW